MAKPRAYVAKLPPTSGGGSQKNSVHCYALRRSFIIDALQYDTGGVPSVNGVCVLCVVRVFGNLCPTSRGYV